MKAFQFFYEGFIKKIDVATNNNFVFFDVRVKASMKKCLYKVILKLSSKSGDVCSAACTCPAGIGLGGYGNCNHVGGVLFALEDFNRHGLQEYPSAISCISKLSSWNVPSATALKSINPAPIDEVIIQKIKFGKDNEKNSVSRYKSFDPRAPSDKTVDCQRLDTLKAKLAECFPSSGFFGFHKLSEPDDSNLTTPAEPSTSHCTYPSMHESIAFNEYYDISSSLFKEMMDIYCQNLTLTQDEITLIETTTRGQASNDNWKKHRMYRITASNFYSAAVNSVEPSRKLNAMYYKSFTSTAVSHGQKYEASARELYIMLLKDNGIQAQVSEVGLQLSSMFPYLGASLDGIVTCKSETWGLEIKCPFSKFNIPLQDAAEDKKFFLARDSSGVRLKHRHPYYFQIQGQMFCANLQRVDLVVWFGSGQPLYVETISYDEEFKANFVLPRIQYFFCRAVLPELFTKRVKQGLKLYLHGGWENLKKK